MTKYNFIQSLFKKYGYIDLDVVAEDLQSFLQTLKDDFYVVKSEILHKQGPGGYPEVRFYGSFDSLWEMIEDYWGDSGLIQFFNELK